MKHVALFFSTVITIHFLTIITLDSSQYNHVLIVIILLFCIFFNYAYLQINSLKPEPYNYRISYTNNSLVLNILLHIYLVYDNFSNKYSVLGS